MRSLSPWQQRKVYSCWFEKSERRRWGWRNFLHTARTEKISRASKAARRWTMRKCPPRIAWNPMRASIYTHREQESESSLLLVVSDFLGALYSFCSAALSLVFINSLIWLILACGGMCPPRDLFEKQCGSCTQHRRAALAQQKTLFIID